MAEQLRKLSFREYLQVLRSHGKEQDAVELQEDVKTNLGVLGFGEEFLMSIPLGQIQEMLRAIAQVPIPSQIQETLPVDEHVFISDNLPPEINKRILDIFKRG